MADARKDKRTLLSLKIRYKSATLEDFIERYSSDISRGGVFIKAKKPLAVGTLLKFEFILQDQSTLIHGVGRVVWRREGAESDPANPSGMGIKFIKMDPESRSVVQRIAEDRGRPGVFDQGKDGIPHAPELASDPSSLAEADRTKVRHVSEFLASALEEGGAGDVAKREAQAGVERARQISDQIGNNRAVAARGAFSAHREAPVDTASVADSPARGAMSAFGGSGLSTSGRISSAAAPAMDELDAEDDFLDDETTKIHDLPESDFPADADATVIAKEAASPFIAEQRLTPVVPASAAMPELRGAVPDLFGPGVGDSFGPAPGEFIDASLLDPAVQTVPPPAGGAPSVPEAPGIPAEAFKLPQGSTPAWTTRPTPQKRRPSAWMFVVGFVLLLGAAGGAAWQLGYADDVMKLAAPYLGQSADPIAQPSPDAVPLVVPTPAPEEASAEAQPEDTIAEAAEPDDSEVEPEAFGILLLIVLRWGKGAYCGWICSCGAMAETLGDEYRTLAPHGPTAKRLENMGQIILWCAFGAAGLHFAAGHAPSSPAPIADTIWGLYRLLIDVVFAGVLGLGVYFFLGGRIWCRYGCPLAALMHVYTRFSPYRIMANKKRCISCNICTKVCHMGIDVMGYANKGIPMNDSECVRCSACIVNCPMQVLTFGSVGRPDPDNAVHKEIHIPLARNWTSGLPNDDLEMLLNEEKEKYGEPS